LLKIWNSFKDKLQIWIKKYNGHEELKSSGTGGSAIMDKGRKTTFEERVEIVQYCIAHNHNYAKTAEQYQVSYQQACSYTVKYEAGGVEDQLSFRLSNRVTHNSIRQPVIHITTNTDYYGNLLHVCMII
jgi:hypothetical protein